MNKYSKKSEENKNATGTISVLYIKEAWQQLDNLMLSYS
jgi:hypothetical protein